MSYIQHGDVLIKQVSSIPKNAKIKKNNRGIVLAEGETTGHAHVIQEKENVELFELDNTLYINVKNNSHVTVTHEEHKPIIIDLPGTGFYEIGIVKEYDHFAEEARSVID